MAKMSKKIPKRAMNEKKKAKRVRSWAKNAAAKVLRIKEQEENRLRNLVLGTNAKQRMRIRKEETNAG